MMPTFAASRAPNHAASVESSSPSWPRAVDGYVRTSFAWSRNFCRASAFVLENRARAAATMSSFIAAARSLDDQLTSAPCEGLMTVWRDGERLGDRHAGVLPPDPRHHVKRHARLQDRAVTTAQARSSLAPGRVIADADRVSEA